jgi:bacteriocin biosynthesis cyclodehydratase domain-containing protein
MLERFDRLLHYLSEWETAGSSRFDLLDRLRSASVAIVGLGGGGSWLAYVLACCGVGRLTLIDGDVVEPSNLSRSILYGEEDVGRPKAAAAAAAVERFTSHTEPEPHVCRIDGAERLAGILEGADLVVGMADQPPWLAREWVARACQATGTPGLQAGGFGVGPLHRPGESACAICLWTERIERNPGLPAALRAQRRLPRAISGGFAPVGAMLAAIAGSDAVRQLAGHQPPVTLDAVWQMNPDFTASFSPLRRRADCPVCGDGAPSLAPSGAVGRS